MSGVQGDNNGYPGQTRGSRAPWMARGLVSAILLIWAMNLEAQPDDLLVLTDTSYFRPGEDNWNLVESVLKDDPASLLLLLNRGADPDSKAEGGMTALMYASEIGDTLLLKLLILNGADVDLTHVEGTTPLMVAVLNQHFDAAHYLLKKGADPNVKDDYHASALHYAAALNNYQLADLLLFFGASDTLRDDQGNDALMTSVFFGNLETTDVLLQDGMGPDSRDKGQRTPLMIAAQQGYGELVRLLMEYGAGMEAVDKMNYTPLAHAIRSDQDTIAEILVDSGANINHLIRPNRNLYDLARMLHRDKILEKLEDRGAKPSPAPDFSMMGIEWGNSFITNEYLMRLRIHMVDRKYGFYTGTGFEFRPVYMTVQVEQGDLLIHQYRESRWIWSQMIGKEFRLMADGSGWESGIYTELGGLLSFTRYRGLSNHPPVSYNLAPSAGFYMKGRIAGFRTGIERYHFGTLREHAWKLNIALFIRFSIQKDAYAFKEIRY